MNAPVQRPSLGRYFSTTLPPLDGRLRMLVLGLLFALAHSRVFEGMVELLQFCPEGFYEPAGIMSWFGPQELAGIHRWADSLLLPLQIAWLMAIVGLGGRWPVLFVGVAMLLLQGWWKGCVGTGHAWYLPTYIFLVLGLFAGNDRYSLDAVLARRFTAYPFRPAQPGSVAASGLPRGLALCLCVFVMASAGLAKLAESGPGWADGASLQAYLTSVGNPKPWGQWLFDLMVAHRWVSAALSVFTFVIELGAPLILFFPGLRLPYVLCAWGFHLGIMALMVPNYLPQMTCYLLIVDWGALLRRFQTKPVAVSAPRVEHAHDRARRALADEVAAVLDGEPDLGEDLALARRADESAATAAASEVPEPVPAATVSPQSAASGPSARVLWVSAAAGSVLSLILISTALVRREYYPLSHIPMYSSRFSDELRGGVPVSQWEDIEGFRALCQRFLADARPYMFQTYVGRKVQIGLRTKRGMRSVTFPVMTRHLPRDRTVWVERAAAAVARDVAQEPPAQYQRGQVGDRRIYDLSAAPMAHQSLRLLSLLAPTARELRLDQQGDSLELFYPEKTFVIVLARIPLR